MKIELDLCGVLRFRDVSWWIGTRAASHSFHGSQIATVGPRMRVTARLARHLLFNEERQMATRWMWTRGLAGLLLGASASVALAQDNGFAPPVSKGTSPQASPDAPAGEVDRKGDPGWGGKSASAGQSATADKTAFFGWGCGLGFNCGLGCAPCRPACRPAYGPACPPVYAPQPCSYPAQPYGYPVGGGNCQPGYGGCPQPGGYYSGPVLPPAISQPIIGTPAPVGYYGQPGYYGGQPYAPAGYGYQQPGYYGPAGYPVYGQSPERGERSERLGRDSTQARTRAVSRLRADESGNPFAD